MREKREKKEKTRYFSSQKGEVLDPFVLGCIVASLSPELFLDAISDSPVC